MSCWVYIIIDWPWNRSSGNSQHQTSWKSFYICKVRPHSSLYKGATPISPCTAALLWLLSISNGHYLCTTFSFHFLSPLPLPPIWLHLSLCSFPISIVVFPFSCSIIVSPPLLSLVVACLHPPPPASTRTKWLVHINQFYTFLPV